MSRILDTIDQSLQEVEEQLLQEFDRIRNSLSDARFAPIDLGVKNALAGIVDGLYDQLDKSGDRQNLQLMTETHEVLLTRIVVLRRLLDAKVPTAYLHEAHTEVVASRKQLEAKVVARRNDNRGMANAQDKTSAQKPAGLMGRLKSIFGGEATEREVSRNRILVTEEEAKALEPVNVYLDNGIYSASRELAALVGVFDLPEQKKEAIQADHERRLAGKAQFASRDLSSMTPESKSGRAQTPDDIRRKLAERQSDSGGKAAFAAKDIEHVQGKDAQPSKPTATEMAHQRRVELEREKAQQPTTGKASFISRDIEPITPQEMRAPVPKPKPQPAQKPKNEPEQPRTGKAVFESKDLSSPPPGNKR
mgnify:FL=1